MVRRVRGEIVAMGVLGSVALALLGCGDDAQQVTTLDAAEVVPADDDAAAQDDVADLSDIPDAAADTALQQDAEADGLEDAEVAPEDTETPPDGGPIVDLPDVGRVADGGGTDAPLGGTRPAEVYLPPDYDAATPAPLVVLLHGYSADGGYEDLYLGFHAQATEAGFIAVVPDGTLNSAGLHYWNADPAWCCNFEHSAVDDAAYLLALIAEASTRYAVDPARVYLAGHSNGGFMAYKMACEHADVIAGVLVIAASTALDATHCAPSRPVTVLHVHGTFDTVIPYLGIVYEFPGAAEVVDRWIAHDGCNETPSSQLGFDEDAAVFGFETTRDSWGGCGAGSGVALWTLYGSTHVPVFTPSFLPDAFAYLLDHGRAPADEP